MKNKKVIFYLYLIGLLTTSFSYAELNEEEFGKLKMAVIMADIEVVKELVPNLDSNEINYEAERRGMTLLHLSINTKAVRVPSDDPEKKYKIQYSDNYPVVEYLLKQKADPNIKDQSGRTAMHLLFSNQKKDNANDYALLDLLLKNGADINEVDYNDNNMFHIVLPRIKKNDLIKGLKEKGLNINAKNKDGNTALHIILTRNPNYFTIKALIVAGAKINMRNNNGLTPLHLAAKNADQKTVDYLLKNGAEIEVLDGNNLSPLSYAVTARKWRIARSLISKGADINVKAGRNETVASIIISNPNSGLSELIKQQGYDPNYIAEGQVWSLFNAIRKLDLKKINALIASGVDINLKNGSKYAAIPALAKSYRKNRDNSKRFELLELFIASGADINAKDNYGHNALHYSAQKDDKKFAELLLNKGIEVNNIGSKDRSAFTEAILSLSFKTAKLLLERGADPIDWSIGYPNFASVITRYRPNNRAKSTPEYRIEMDEIVLEMLKADFSFNLDDHGSRNTYEMLGKVDNDEIQLQLKKIKISYDPRGSYAKSIQHRGASQHAQNIKNKKNSKSSVNSIDSYEAPEYLQEALAGLPAEQREQLLSLINKNSAVNNEQPVSSCSFRNLPKDYEVHAVGTYKGLGLVNVTFESTSRNIREAEVVVNRPGKSTLLVLMAYDPVVWKVKRTSGSKVIGVIAGGYYAQQVIGLGNTTPILHANHKIKTDCPSIYAYKAGRKLDKAEKNIEKILGKKITKFITKPKDEIFIVGEGEQFKENQLVYKVEVKDSQYDIPSIPKGMAGLRLLEKQGKLKMATPEDIDAWVEAASKKYKSKGKDLKVGHYMHVGSTYVIKKELFLPDDLHGGNSVSFIIPKGIPKPHGPPGHNKFYFMDGGFCTLAFITECPGT
tara:strand:+ start:2879 stop:5569 length:2691 start_codon:yes stop_codon:yes gene_type:complete